KKIDELRASEREYRARLATYLESQLQSWASPALPRSARAPSPKATVLTHQHTWLLVLVPARRDMKPETGHPTGKSTTNRITAQPSGDPALSSAAWGSEGSPTAVTETTFSFLKSATERCTRSLADTVGAGRF